MTIKQRIRYLVQLFLVMSIFTLWLFVSPQSPVSSFVSLFLSLGLSGSAWLLSQYLHTFILVPVHIHLGTCAHSSWYLHTFILLPAYIHLNTCIYLSTIIYSSWCLTPLQSTKTNNAISIYMPTYKSITTLIHLHTTNTHTYMKTY